MWYKGLLLLFMLMTDSVLSIGVGTGVDVSKETFVEPRYERNHPPTAEYYMPIPVAVVYENSEGENSSKTAKALKLDDDKEVKLTEDTVQTSTESEQITPESINTTGNKRTTEEALSKPRALDELQIPVTVIYESAPSSYQNYGRVNAGTNDNNSKKRIIRKETPQTKINENALHKEPPSKVNPATSPPVDTRVFQKRVGGRDPFVPIIESESYVFSHRGNFHYRYEGGDGTKAYSEGSQKTIDGKAGESVVGGFSYTDKDGNNFSLSYTADENGYRPVGAHLPTPPPIPPAIARALKHLATATPEPVTERHNTTS